MGTSCPWAPLPAKSPSNVLVTMKVEGIEQEKLRSLLEPVVQEIQDIRTC